MPEYKEDEVLARASQGDREAFGVLYEQYIVRIFNYVYYRTGNVHDAEDLTARVFYRALHHIRNYNDRGVPFSAWLYRIAHNLVANWHRDRSRRQEIPLSDTPNLPYRGPRGGINDGIGDAACIALYGLKLATRSNQ